MTSIPTKRKLRPERQRGRRGEAARECVPSVQSGRHLRLAIVPQAAPSRTDRLPAGAGHLPQRSKAHPLCGPRVFFPRGAATQVARRTRVVPLVVPDNQAATSSANFPSAGTRTRKADDTSVSVNDCQRKTDLRILGRAIDPDDCRLDHVETLLDCNRAAPDAGTNRPPPPDLPERESRKSWAGPRGSCERFYIAGRS